MRFEPDTPYTGLKNKPDIFYDEIEKDSRLGKFLNRFGNIIRIIFLIGAGVGIAMSIAKLGSSIGLLMIVAMIALPTAYAIIVYPHFGILVLLVMAYFIMFLLRLIEGYPLGTIMDALQYMLIAGFFLKQKYNKNWAILKSPISTTILIWFTYNILQVGNPSAESRLAWLYTVRTVAVVNLMYFIFMYYIRSVEYIRIIFRLWMALSIFAALYAMKQEYIGFFEFEERALNDPLVYLLLFINGSWRKFSIFSDPVAFSYNMVASALFCIAMCLCAPISNRAKIIYGGIAGLLLTSMLYSGTRGAYVLAPASLVLYLVMHLNKKTITIGIAGGLFFLALINVPTGNATLYRFQSAFKPSEDASYNVRKTNQKRIQPYIQKHPLGGGLGATGVWGVRFAPYSYLANFPPDSGYVRVAVELGWIGLLIYCYMMYTIITTGIKNYYIIKDQELKAYCLAMILVIFALNFGNFPQEALVQFPTSIYIYLFIALINITRRLDDEKNGLIKPEKKPLLLRQQLNLYGFKRKD